MNLRLGSTLSALVLSMSTLAVAAPASAAPLCDGLRATIVGTDQDDTVAGTAKRDVIVTLAGSDQIDGLGGDDVICAGDGDDRLYGSTGDDVLEGQGGSDTFHDGAGNDVVNPGPGMFAFISVLVTFRGPASGALRAPFDAYGDDVVYAEPGNDTITGRGFTIDFSKAKRGVRMNLAKGVARGIGKDVVKGAQEVIGSRYDDRVVGSKRQDVINTGAGRDEILGLGGGDLLDAGRGRDVVSGGGGADFGFFFNDVADLGPGSDFGFASESTVEGGDGDDYVATFAQADVTGGAGSDTLQPQGDDFLAGMTVDLTTGVASTGVTFSGFENVTGGEGNDVLTGDADANTILGGNGNDVIVGSGGNDTLMGNEGEDAADGGDGTDVCNAELETTCE